MTTEHVVASKEKQANNQKTCALIDHYLYTVREPKEKLAHTNADHCECGAYIACWQCEEKKTHYQIIVDRFDLCK